jgi:hypothetical protein
MPSSNGPCRRHSKTSNQQILVCRTPGTALLPAVQNTRPIAARIVLLLAGASTSNQQVQQGIYKQLSNPSQLQHRKPLASSNSTHKKTIYEQSFPSAKVCEQQAIFKHTAKASGRQCSTMPERHTPSMDQAAVQHNQAATADLTMTDTA